MKTTILGALLLLSSLAVSAQVGRLLPVDEAVKNPELFVFRARLQAAVARHDADAVLALVDPHVKNGFGGGGGDGAEAFKRLWKLPGGEKLWDELGTLLALGGSLQSKDSFAAPYVYSAWPDSLDAFGHVAVVGSNVRVRAEPKLDGRVLATLSFDLVPIVPRRPGASEDWTSVKLRDGRVGYVSSAYVRSSVDYRAFFSRTAGGWRLTLLAAGD